MQIGAEYLSLVQELMKNDADEPASQGAQVGRSRSKQEREGRSAERGPQLNRIRSRSTGPQREQLVSRENSLLDLFLNSLGDANAEEETDGAASSKSFARPLAALMRAELTRNRRLARKQRLDLPVPSVVFALVEHMREAGHIEEQGVFRKSGRHTDLQQLQAAFDHGLPVQGLMADADACTLADLLKAFLMQLPHPLVPESMYPHFHAVVYHKLEQDAKKKETMVAAGVAEDDIARTLAGNLQWVELLGSLIAALPVEARALLCYLFDFLTQVSFAKEKNLMGTKNLSTVFSPAIFGSMDPIKMMAAAGDGLRRAFGPEQILQDVRDKSYVLQSILDAWPYLDIKVSTAARVYEATSSQPVPRTLSARPSGIDINPFPLIKGDVVVAYQPIDPNHPTCIYAELCHTIGVVHAKQLVHTEKITFEIAATKCLEKHIRPFSVDLLAAVQPAGSQPAIISSSPSNPTAVKKKHKRSKSSVVGRIGIFG